MQAEVLVGETLGWARLLGLSAQVRKQDLNLKTLSLGPAEGTRSGFRPTEAWEDQAPEAAESVPGRGARLCGASWFPLVPFDLGGRSLPWLPCVQTS